MTMRLLAGSVLLAASAFADASAQTGATTGITGGGQPFSIMQPSLPITMVMPTAGVYPAFGGSGPVNGGTLGFLQMFAGNFPAGGPAAAGELLLLQQYLPLFTILGTSFGGDGRNTFALPDLQGTALIGAGTGAGLPSLSVGSAIGSPAVALDVAQLPPHDHTLPGGGVTGMTGGGQPFSNVQPSLALNPMIAIHGSFPSGGGVGFLGEIGWFAGDLAPAGWAPADGQALSIQQNAALYAVLGTTYGGNGATTFDLPNLQGRLAVGADPANPLGQAFGTASTTLTVAQLPPHDHTLPGGGVTGMTGGGQPVSLDQPSLPINYLISLHGIFPTSGSGGYDPTTPFLGEIVPFAGNVIPDGWALADGQLLSIQQNAALFALLGTMYGGNGTFDFALPDLEGRTVIGSGQHGGIDYTTGVAVGADTTTLSVANLPPHDHTLPPVTPPVPEPGSLGLLGAGLLALGVLRRSRRD